LLAEETWRQPDVGPACGNFFGGKPTSVLLAENFFEQNRHQFCSRKIFLSKTNISFARKNRIDKKLTSVLPAENFFEQN
jgi:hypothetical protein